ncbi:MAG: hypothetical protein ACLRP3_19765 [Escherichia sp.]
MQVALGTNRSRCSGLCRRNCRQFVNHTRDLGEISQFAISQRQESEADDYSYDLLRQRGISPAGLATSFEKRRN